MEVDFVTDLEIRDFNPMNIKKCATINLRSHHFIFILHLLCINSLLVNIIIDFKSNSENLNSDSFLKF